MDTIKKDIENIGLINYPWTIITGRNREVYYLTKGKEQIHGKFILTIGKKAVILTDHINGRREPIIVRKWKRIEKSTVFLYTEKFKDSKGWEWIYSKDERGGQWMAIEDKNGQEYIAIRTEQETTLGTSEHVNENETPFVIN